MYQVLLVLLAGGVAFTGHAAKAATRLAVNHSPEPFSNVAVSLAEDAAVGGGLYLLVKHPWVMAGIAAGFLLLFAWLAPRVFRALRAEWTTFGALRELVRRGSQTSTPPRGATMAGGALEQQGAARDVRGDRHSRPLRVCATEWGPFVWPTGRRSSFSEVGACRGSPDRHASAIEPGDGFLVDNGAGIGRRISKTVHSACGPVGERAGKGEAVVTGHTDPLTLEPRICPPKARQLNGQTGCQNTCGRKFGITAAGA